MTKIRNPERIPMILESLRQYWQANPDMRLGQIIIDAHSMVWPLSDSHVFQMEDYYFLEGLCKLDTYHGSSTVTPVVLPDLWVDYQ